MKYHGNAFIQIDNVELGKSEIENDLKNNHFTNIHVELASSHPTEHLPDDWFEDYDCEYSFTAERNKPIDEKDTFCYVTDIERI